MEKYEAQLGPLSGNPPERANPSHMMIHHAVNDSFQIIDRLDNLIGRLEGPKPETLEEKKPPRDHEPTFVEVLGHTDARVRTLTSEALQRIEYLESLLLN